MARGLFGFGDGSGPDADPGEEVELVVSGEVVSPNIDN